VVPRAYARAVIERLDAAARAGAGQPGGAASETAQAAALDRYFDELDRHGLLVSPESPSS
jgi:hypothetical protein